MKIDEEFCKLYIGSGNTDVGVIANAGWNFNEIPDVDDDNDDIESGDESLTFGINNLSIGQNNNIGSGFSFGFGNTNTSGAFGLENLNTTSFGGTAFNITSKLENVEDDPEDYNLDDE